MAIGSETHNPGLLHASIVTSGYGYNSCPNETYYAHESNDTAQEEHFTSQSDGTSDARNDSSTSNGIDSFENISESAVRQNAPVAFIGSIGPQHMDYVATMAAVKAVARYLNAFIAQNR